MSQALEALPEIAAEAGESRYTIRSESDALAEVSAGRRLGARLVFLGSADYPAALYDLTDPPPVLWAYGDLSLASKPSISLIGARNASAVGARMATRLSEELGQAGHIIVSGLARGIDAAAHLAALPTGTIAVMAGGVDIAYPKETASLMEDIGKSGLRLSEMPLGTQPKARHFPRRNRIVAGLGRGVVVVEAAAKSGTMITARAALDIGRDILAVPGHPMDARAAGCNMLIRDGATLVRSAADILEALETPAPFEPDLPLILDTHQDAFPKTQPPDVIPTTPQNDLAAHILSLLGTAPVSEDVLIRNVTAPPPHVMSVLAELDIQGEISRMPGGLVARAA